MVEPDGAPYDERHVSPMTPPSVKSQRRRWIMRRIAIVLALLAGAYVFSGFRSVGAGNIRYGISIMDGVFWMMTQAGVPAGQLRWSYDEVVPWWAMWKDLKYHGLLPERIAPRGRVTHYFVPLWFPFAFAAMLVVIRGYQKQFRSTKHCGGCGYDLTGNTSGACPECGACHRSPRQNH